MPPKNKQENELRQALSKYGGLAFQMMAIIAVGVFIGTQIDSYFQIEEEYGTLICTLLFVFFSLFYVLKDFIKPAGKR